MIKDRVKFPPSFSLPVVLSSALGMFTFLRTKAKELTMMSPGHRWQGQLVISQKKKTKKQKNTNPPVTPHLLYSQALALPSISDIVPGQWNLHLHITCQILRSTCKTILLSPDDTNLTRKPTNNTACHQSFIFSFKFLLVPSIYPPLCGMSRFQRLVRDGS